MKSLINARHMPLCPSASHDDQHVIDAELDTLCEQLLALPELHAKKSIRVAAVYRDSALTLNEKYAQPGDDCSAIATHDGYQLFAMEGMLPDFVRLDPKAAGWSSVMANVSDIAAMGGRPIAVVNAFWHNNDVDSDILLSNIKRACRAWGVTFAGGHSSIQPSYSPHLAVGILGHANKLLSCYHVKPGQRLFMLSDLTGSWHGDMPYWGCVVGKTEKEIQAQWDIPAQLAEKGLAVAAKDISGGGVLGTLLMMLELTGCGADIDLSAIPKPKGDLLRWLRAFQSYGFLLAVEPEQVSDILGYFQKSHLTCCPMGTVTQGGQVNLQYKGSKKLFWDLTDDDLTHMGIKKTGTTY